MPRRIPDYPSAYLEWNQFMSLGSILTFISLIIFLYIVLFQLFAHSRGAFHPRRFHRFEIFRSYSFIMDGASIGGFLFLFGFFTSWGHISCNSSSFTI